MKGVITSHRFHPWTPSQQDSQDENELKKHSARDFQRLPSMSTSGFHPTTIYLWLISLAASKELSILLLKLLKCKSNRYSDFILGLRARTAVC